MGGGLRTLQSIVLSLALMKPQYPMKLQRLFEELNVEHIARQLNTDFPKNGFANKPVVCSWAERNIEKDVLVFLDSDLVFFNEPTELFERGFLSGFHSACSREKFWCDITRRARLADLD